MPNFKLEIVDLCDGNSVLRSSATYPYLWKRVRVVDESRFDNRCPAIRVTLDDNSYYQNVRYAVAGYMFGPDNPFWELH